MIKKIFGNIARQIADLKRQVFQKGSFAQNFMMLFSSNVISQIVGILLLPIISRLYSPEVYGVFSIYIVISTLIAKFSTLRYDIALLLPEKDREFKEFVHLCIFLVVLVTMISLPVFGFLGSIIFGALNRPELSSYWYLVSFAIFIHGMTFIVAAWNIREKEYKKTSIIGVVRNILGRVLNIGYALLFSATFLGLLWGDLITSIVVLILNYFFIIQPKIQPYLKRSTWKDMWRVALKYRDYPRVVLPAWAIEIISQQFPIYFFAILGSKSFLGLYMFGQRLLEIPINIINNAIGPIFFQKVVEVKQQKGDAWKITRKLILSITAVSTIPLGFLIVWGDYIFKYVFGAEWEQAGIITSYLGLAYMLQMIYAIISKVFNAYNKEGYILYLNAFNFLIRIASLSVCVYYEVYNFDMLLWYSIGNMICFFVGILGVVHILKGSKFYITLYLSLVLGSGILFWWGLRELILG